MFRSIPVTQDERGHGDLEALSIDFLNSEWHDWRGSGRARDRLTDEEWRQGFLGRWNLGDPGPVTGAVLDELISLRLLLRGIVAAESGGRGLDPDQVRRLNAYLERVPLLQQVECVAGELRVELVPQTKDWSWVMAKVAVSFAGLLAQDPRRLKACANPDCRWVFWDESRNRTRRWCEPGVCGSLIKVRRFRARKRGGDEGPLAPT